jgi:L-fucose mutarotase
MATTMGLLKGIDPLLTADLLHILRSMGHGDKLCICDANFPAASIATTHTTTSAGQLPRMVVLAGASLPDAVSAICSVLPLDFFVESPARYMSPQDGVAMPEAGVEVIEETKLVIALHAGQDEVVNILPLERFAFYDEARTCFAICQTQERRPYGNVILTKGVIGPDGKDLKPQNEC